jgi:pSer/pThr/pTyr-binding forkhead associated (FHA) protein
MNTQEISKNQIGSRGLKLTVMTLDINPGSKPVTQVFYKDELTLGRLPSNDVVLGRPEISGIHARLRIEKGDNGDPDRLFITDLGSSNGTTVEKNQLRPRIEIAMMPNERIFIGNYVIKPSILTSASEGLFSKSTDQAPIESEAGDSSPTKTLNRSLFSDSDQETQPSTSKNNLFSSDSSSSNSSISSWNLNSDSSIIFSETSDTVGNEEPVLNQEQDSDSRSTDSLTDDSNGESSSLTENNENSNDRKKTMEFTVPFGTPLTKEEEYSRGAKEVPEVSLNAFSSTYEGVTKNSFSEQAAPTQPLFSQSKEFHSSLESKEMTSEYRKTEDVLIDAYSPVTSSSGSHIVTVKVDGDDVRSMNFVARAYTNLKGKVVHKDRPLPGVLVDAGSFGTSITDADGSFTVSNILEGTDYCITLSKEKFQFLPLELTGTVSLDSDIISVQASQLFTISGIITHHGNPLSGVEVDGGEIGKVLTKEDGSYLFENVPEGKEYNLTLKKEGYDFNS